MKYLLIAATAREVEPLLDYLKLATDKKINVPDILITGIGLTAATYRLTSQLQAKNYDLVIQAGIAGSFDKKLSLGSVVVVKQDVIADQGVVEQRKFKTLFDLKLVAADAFPYTKTWLVNPHAQLLKRAGLKQVKGISVNEITTSRPRTRFYEERLKASTESMEGAALHYCCLMAGVAFLQVRSLSNYIGERNKKNWKIKEAIINLNMQIIQLLETL